ncbi:MAG: AI-2E family transporter [Alphaproteobacteria bacterium]|nr:AI-2E family transporter [Alphaproteobacteria bacterium]
MTVLGNNSSTSSGNTPRADQAWAIAVGGSTVVVVAGLLLVSWHFATTLLLIFTGILLGIALNALTKALGRVIRLPHTLRLVIVCLVLAVLLVGVGYLGGATIVDQASALSETIKSQLANLKAFLDHHGIDTGFFAIGGSDAAAAIPTAPSATATSARSSLPSASALASNSGAIISQTVNLLVGAVSVVGNFFVVLFLGIAFAAQPELYHSGAIYLAPARHRARLTRIINDISQTLERWLLAQTVVMFAVGTLTWIGLAVIGVPAAFILGLQTGLLAFIPRIGTIIGGAIVVLASLASGWVPAISAFFLIYAVHALESYVLTPVLQRQALDIPTATLFAFQILLGVIFGIWGLALALPLTAIAKVLIDDIKRGDPLPQGAA